MERCFVVEGWNLVEEAVATGFARELYLGPGLEASPRREALRAANVPVEELEQRDVCALGETKTPSGAFALVESPWEEFDAASLPERCVVLLAAGVADPGNLGTLIRTSAALGASAVVATPGTVEPTNPKVVRASAGALFRIPVFQGTPAALGELGFAIFVADRSGEPVGALASRPPRVALALGNEPHGLGDALKERAEKTVAVEIAAGVESLNVAVAAGILLHALTGVPVNE